MEISSVSSSIYQGSGSGVLSADAIELIDEIVTAPMETAQVHGEIGVSLIKGALENAQMSSYKILSGGLDILV